MDAASLAQVKAAVESLKGDPSLAHTPDLAFFKDFLGSWGGAVPKCEEKKKEEPKKEEPKEKPKEPEPKAAEPKAAEPKAPEPEEEEEEEPPIPEEPEEEDPERLPEDTDPFPEKSPGNELDLTDEQMDKQGELKQAAAEALEDGDTQKALDKFTEAIKIGNVSAMMYAKRADMLLKMKRPCACIADCDAALEVNPDSAKAFRIRGKAHRKLGHWEQAHNDIAVAQKLDLTTICARWKNS